MVSLQNSLEQPHILLPYTPSVPFQLFHPQSLHSTVFANITRCTSPLGDPQSPKGALLGGRTPPAIETSIFAIRPIANGFWIFGNPEAIQADCAPIGPELCPLRLHLDCDSRPQVGALTPDPCPGILCNPLDTSQSYRNPRIHKGWSCKLWPCEFGMWNKRNGTVGGSKVVVYGCSRFYAKRLQGL